MAGETGRFAVNGLLGLNATFALYIVGPVLGGVIVATSSAGVALFFDACGALILLAAVLISVPRAVEDRDALRRPTARESGWRILRRCPVAARLLVVVFFFNFFYMPIEVALPLYVRGTLDADASALGLMWGALGVGAFIGAALVNQIRNLPQRHLLIAIIGLWAVCPIVLGLVGDLTVAMIVFGLGGLVWAPFTPVAYSFLQSSLEPHEQQQVVTLWTTGSMVAAPLGLTAGGPLIEFAGTSGGLVLSGVLTLLLLPIAALAVLARTPASITLPRASLRRGAVRLPDAAAHRAGRQVGRFWYAVVGDTSEPVDRLAAFCLASRIIAGDRFAADTRLTLNTAIRSRAHTSSGQPGTSLHHKKFRGCWRSPRHVSSSRWPVENASSGLTNSLPSEATPSLPARSRAAERSLATRLARSSPLLASTCATQVCWRI
jgi:MFS family permease